MFLTNLKVISKIISMGWKSVRKRRIIDFDEKSSEIQQSIIETSNNLEETKEKCNKTIYMLAILEDELNDLDITTTKEPFRQKNDSNNIFSNAYYIKLYKKLEKQIMKEKNSYFKLHSNMTKLDYIVACLIGSIGVIVDMLVVKIPSQMTYLDTYLQEGSKMTKWLKSLGVDEDGKLKPFLAGLEKSSKVSYDASSKYNLKGYKNDISGFYPKTHRLMSLGHDPFFGLIFGLLDILNCGITLIDSKGVIHQVKLEKYQNLDLSDKIFAPYLW